MTIANVWILLCDASHARLLETHGRVHVWKHVRDFHRHERDRGEGLDADEWIRMLAGVLSQGRLWKRYSKLVLVAPAGVLDKLHATLTDEVADTVLATVERDLVDVPLRELPDLLSGDVRPRMRLESRAHV